MEYRTLGSGLRVSVLTFGTVTFGGRGDYARLGATDVSGAERQIDMCLDAGVNLIDTANIYSRGLSEDILGKVLQGRRHRLLLATKARSVMGDGPNDAGASRLHLLHACDESLRRLRVDHIDLYQLHGWDGETPIEETLGALDTLVQQGKVRYVGVSNYAGWQLMKATAATRQHGFAKLVSHQFYYSLQCRDAEWELLPSAIDQGLGVLVWSPLAGGLLSGKYRRTMQRPAGSRHETEWYEPPVRDWEALYDVVELLVEIGDAHGVSAAQVALAWLLGRPAVTSLVIGARTDAQLADNLAAANFQLAADERDALDAATAQPLPYPHWHQAINTCDRLGPAERALLQPHLQRPNVGMR